MAALPHLQIADIWIDVSVREVHEIQAEVTRHPVEEGTDISDHVRLMPRTLQIEGIVTNHPIELPKSHVDGARIDKSGFTIEGEPTLGMMGFLPGAAQTATLVRTFSGKDLTSRRLYQVNGIAFTKPFDRVRAVDLALQTTIDNRKPVQIITGLRVYESVVLTDFSVVREAGAGGTVLKFGCQGEVIRVVKSGSAIVGKPETLARAKPKVNEGNQSTTPADEDLNQSLVSKMKDRVKAAGGIVPFVQGLL